MLDKLTKRDAHFLGYANAYQERIERIDIENKHYRESMERWPNASYIPELKQRVENNEREKRQLQAKITRIMANVRR
jgi:uncharacterized protein (UPF0335 family)